MRTTDLIDSMFGMEKQAARAGISHIKTLLKEFDTLAPSNGAYDAREIGRNIEAQKVMDHMSRIIDTAVPKSVESIGQLHNPNAMSQYQVLYPKYPTEDLRNYLTKGRKRNKVDFATNQFFSSERPMPPLTESEEKDALQNRKLQRRLWHNDQKMKHKR